MSERGQSFAFTPFGIVPVEEQASAQAKISDEYEFAPGAVPEQQVLRLESPRAPAQPVAATPTLRSEPFTAKAFSKQIDARIRDLKKQLAVVPKIERELAELERLRDAMKNAPKPAQVVRLRARGE